MGWTKREEALDYLTEKRAYHHAFAWINAARAEFGKPNEAGRRHFTQYLVLCKMLAAYPDEGLEQFYGETDETYGRGTGEPR